jgi:hypothetical protein
MMTLAENVYFVFSKKKFFFFLRQRQCVCSGGELGTGCAMPLFGEGFDSLMKKVRIFPPSFFVSCCYCEGNCDKASTQMHYKLIIMVSITFFDVCFGGNR